MSEQTTYTFLETVKEVLSDATNSFQELTSTFTSQDYSDQSQIKVGSSATKEEYDCLSNCY